MQTTNCSNSQGETKKIKVSRHHTLAFKEALGRSWRQGKLLKNVGIQLESERSVRVFSKEIVSDFVEVENREFVKEDGDGFTAPYSRIAGLTNFVDNLLDSYDKQNMLTWHSNTIPNN